MSQQPILESKEVKGEYMDFMAKAPELNELKASEHRIEAGLARSAAHAGRANHLLKKSSEQLGAAQIAAEDALKSIAKVEESVDALEKEIEETDTAIFLIKCVGAVAATVFVISSIWNRQA